MSNESEPISPEGPSLTGPGGGPPETFPWYTVWLKAFTSPTLDTYSALIADPAATAGRGLLWVVLAGLVGGILIALSTLTTGSLMGSFTNQRSVSSLPAAGGALFATICVSLFIVPIAVALSAGVFQLIARLFGGVGTYSKQFYMESTLFAPAFLIGAVLGIIPFVGACIGGLFSLYTLYLRVLAINAVQRIGWGKSVATFLIPAVAVALLAICVIATLGILGAGVYQQFNQINPNFGP